MIEWSHAFGDQRPRFAAPPDGTPGDDAIKGTKRADIIDVSQGGDDVVDARAGDDMILFGATLTSADRIDGFRGLDTLVLQGDYAAGIDLDGSFIQGIEHVDLLAGGSYTIAGDFAFGDSVPGVRIDARALGPGDVLRFDGSGSTSKLSVFGGAGDDVLVASHNFGGLWGGAGDDQLFGDDRFAASFEGGLGADTMTIRTDRTQVFYEDAADSTKRNPDLIIGFRSDSDLVLEDVDADTSQDGDQAFHLGSTPGHVGDVVIHYNKAADLTIVRAFTDGDAKADMEIHLQGHVPLTADNFFL